MYKKENEETISLETPTVDRAETHQAKESEGVEELEKKATVSEGVDGDQDEKKEPIEEQYMRLCATFDNYKKRVHKEQLLWIKQANKRLLLSLLPVLDDFELALVQQQQQGDESVEKVFQGINLIYKKLRQLLTDEGLEEIKVAVGDFFNPDLHEALTSMPTEDEGKKDTITQIVNKGYMLHGHVFRFAKVIVYT